MSFTANWPKPTPSSTRTIRPRSRRSSFSAAGTPEQVLEKIRYIHETVALDHMVGTFAFGGPPAPKLNRSFQLFAEKVLPVLQTDPAFQLPKEQAEFAAASV